MGARCVSARYELDFKCSYIILMYVPWILYSLLLPLSPVALRPNAGHGLLILEVS